MHRVHQAQSGPLSLQALHLSVQSDRFAQALFFAPFAFAPPPGPAPFHSRCVRVISGVSRWGQLVSTFLSYSRNIQAKGALLGPSSVR